MEILNSQNRVSQPVKLALVGPQKNKEISS